MTQAPPSIRGKDLLLNVNGRAIKFMCRDNEDRSRTLTVVTDGEPRFWFKWSDSLGEFVNKDNPQLNLSYSKVNWISLMLGMDSDFDDYMEIICNSPALSELEGKRPAQAASEEISSGGITVIDLDDIPEPKKPEIINPIHDGTYTAVFRDGSYRTVRFNTPTSGNLAGKTIVAYLAGPDNSRDFVGCAFYNQERASLHMWGRFKEDTALSNGLQLAIHAIRGNLEEAQQAYAIKSGNCAKCGKKLTVPASLYAGMGPKCRAGGVD